MITMKICLSRLQTYPLYVRMMDMYIHIGTTPYLCTTKGIEDAVIHFVED